jgi:hypothetical protein
VFRDCPTGELGKEDKDLETSRIQQDDRHTTGANKYGRTSVNVNSQACRTLLSGNDQTSAKKSSN